MFLGEDFQPRIEYNVVVVFSVLSYLHRPEEMYFLLVRTVISIFSSLKCLPNMHALGVSLGQCLLAKSSIYSVFSVCLFLSLASSRRVYFAHSRLPTHIYFSTFIYGALICYCFFFCFRLLICCFTRPYRLC